MNIIHTRWDTFFKSLIFKDVNGTAIDITWVDITFTLKSKIEDTTWLLQATATITDWANWKAEISISGTYMELDIANYYYDIQYTDTSNTIVTILKWLFTITYDITN